MTHAKRNEEIVCYKRFDPIEYPEYDNIDAVEVSKVKDIPIDYEGVMGVPITFLDRYNPDQFEIVGLDRDIMWGFIPQYAKNEWDGSLSVCIIDGIKKYARILIRHRRSKR